MHNHEKVDNIKWDYSHITIGPMFIIGWQKNHCLWVMKQKFFSGFTLVFVRALELQFTWYFVILLFWFHLWMSLKPPLNFKLKYLYYNKCNSSMALLFMYVTLLPTIGIIVTCLLPSKGNNLPLMFLWFVHMCWNFV
jgi:hypothetical protein